MRKNEAEYYLICERRWIYWILIVVSGFWGAYTYLLKGNVFCNAQTGNVVLMGLSIGSGHWRDAVYYIIPISAYMAGSLVSELLPNPVKHHLPVRWDTLLIGIEMVVIVFLGLVPDTAPVQIAQVSINFIASMQFNTFRQAEGIPMATTFATNHIRQIGICLAKEILHKKSADKSHRARLLNHAIMILFFILGVIVGTQFCNLLSGKAIWITLLPLAVVLVSFTYADLIKEKHLMLSKPGGH